MSQLVTEASSQFDRIFEVLSDWTHFYNKPQLITMNYNIRGRNLGENISNHKALQHIVPVLESMEGMSAGSEEYHQEEDLLEHTLMVYDEMLEINDSDEALLMALVHDIGKILTQGKSNDAKHDMIGGRMTEWTLLDTAIEEELVQTLVHACEQHLRIKYVTEWAGQNKMSESKLIKMKTYFDEEEIDIDRMLDLAQADARGRKPTQSVDLVPIKERLQVAGEVKAEVDEDYSLNKRDAEKGDYTPEAMYQMMEQDMVELLKEKES